MNKQYYIKGDAGYFYGSIISGRALYSPHPTRKDFDECHFTQDPTLARVFGSIEEASRFLDWGTGCKIMEILQDSGNGTYKDHVEVSA